jgi:dTDP-4-amino-4,6-dideoxygalactose transaminase
LSDWRVSLSELEYGPAEEAAARRVLQSRWLTMGSEVRAFEERFAEMVDIPHAIAVTNGTAALHLVLAALGVGQGDEVIQPSINFVAAANMTRALGATPVFADIVGIDEPTLDPAAVERLMTPRTKVVVAMHYGGYLCRMAQLHDLCEARGVALVEDACHAPGARYRDEGHRLHGRHAGALSRAGCFSFFSNKNLTTGEGGMITTDSDRLAREMRLRRSHGMTTSTLDRHRGHAFDYDVTAVGFNYRPTELMGALGQVQLAKLDEGNDRRRAHDEIYRAGLATVPGVVVPFADHASRSACHLMPVVLPAGSPRQEIMRTLRSAGVQSSIHYRAIHTMSAYREYASADLPRSVAYCQRELTLPMFPGLRRDQVDLVVETVGRSLAQHAA